MELEKILALSSLLLIILIVAGCTGGKQQDEDCNNHYLVKFGLSVNDVVINNTECEWTPNDMYGVVDSKFKAQIKDTGDNNYNLFYKKGCCHRHAYAGFTICIMSQNGETELFKKMKSEICNDLNNQFGNFTAQCENGEFEKREGNSIILSLKNDYIGGGIGSNIETVSIESNNCLDLN